MSVQTVFLDAGGVLAVPNWERVAGFLQAQGIEVDPPALAAADHLAKFQFDVGGYIQASTDGERWHRYFELVFAQAGIRPSPGIAPAIDAMRAYHDAHNLWETVPDEVRPALARLRKLGLCLAVVSNANGTIADAFERAGLSEDVDIVIDSHYEGIEKPDPRLFQIALERAGGRAETTIHIGDLFHVDVVGARAAGIRAVLLDAAGLYKEYDCPRVGSLTEFVDRLESGAFESMSGPAR
jgi:HAD superfamily hydrolase (TIGR01509 family)